jgi:hypothetical protein
MRRKLIYPHRSVRSMPLTTLRISVAIITALALTIAVYWYRAGLLDLHNRITAGTLTVAGIPFTNSQFVETFEPIGTAQVVTTSVFSPVQQPIRLVLLFALVVASLFAVYRWIALSRSFIVFLWVILIATGVILLFVPTAEVTSAEFSQIWMRSEVLVWFLLPWLCAPLLVIFHPNIWPGVGWAAVMQVYGFVWSAVRLAFCLGVLHFTGLLFMPVLWFALGLLADVLYIIVFISISARASGARAWGGRASWQF